VLTVYIAVSEEFLSTVDLVYGRLSEVLRELFSSEVYRQTVSYSVEHKSVLVFVQRKEVTTNMANDPTLEERVEQLEASVAELEEWRDSFNKPPQSKLPETPEAP
jgi:uncharacterized protein YceH (UPF0502 family)